MKTGEQERETGMGDGGLVGGGRAWGVADERVRGPEEERGLHDGY